MKILLRVLRLGLLSLLALLALAGALFAYFLYTPTPEQPALSGRLTRHTLVFGGLQRSYLSYQPQGLPKGAPLLLVMHGSGEGAQQVRSGTGYGFERLADAKGFALVYPNSGGFDWNDCSRIGDYRVNGQEVDDLGFLAALVERLVAEAGVDRGRVFATGVSAGGSMAIRLALEEPRRYRAVAAVAANVPTLDNFKCRPAGPGSSVMIMNGTQDPLVPFDGGEVNLLGLFYKAGEVRSSRDSARYFADLNQLGAAPVGCNTPVAEGVRVEQLLWRQDARAEVELLAIHGGGHGLPQPHARGPRLLGPSPTAPDGPALIWEFFARQRR